MPELKGDTDFGILLEATDARSVARTGIDDDEGTLGVIDLHAFRRDDPDQGIVDGTLKGPPVRDHLPLKCQKRRWAFFLMLDVDIAALAQDIPEEHRPLGKINRV